MFQGIISISKCRLKVVYSKPENFISLLTVDYGKRGNDNYRGAKASLGRNAIEHSIISPFFAHISRPPPAEWILHLARDINQKYFQRKNYFVLHLRGRDRHCLSLKGYDFMTSRFKAWGLRSKETVYLMSDMEKSHPVVKSVHNYFHNRVLTSNDIEIFKKYPFIKNNYLVFSVELGLVYFSTAFANTYPHSNLGPLSKEMKSIFHRQRVHFVNSNACMQWIFL